MPVCKRQCCHNKAMQHAHSHMHAVAMRKRVVIIYFCNHLIFSYDGSKFDCMMNMTNLKNLFFVFCEVHEAKKVALELKISPQ